MKTALRFDISYQHIIKKFLWFAVILFARETLTAQLTKKYKGYEEGNYRSTRYGLFKPVKDSPSKVYPLIVYLHGSNDTMSRDLIWYQDSIQNKTPCFVLSPKCFVSDQGWGNTWRDDHTKATSETLKLIDSLIKVYPMDTNRLYLYGISMGGFGVFSILAKEPGKFAAAYAVCGGSNASAASKLTQTPFWIFHGEKDDVVLLKYSEDVYREMIRLGGRSVRFTKYPDVNHNSWENVSREQTLPTWLFKQQKNLNSSIPESVSDFNANLIEKKGVQLSWKIAPKPTKSDNEVWYYKLYRDNKLIAEMDGGLATYNDLSLKSGNSFSYSIVAVNYFFKESRPSQTLTIKFTY